MNIQTKDNEEYTIPFKEKSGFKWTLHVLFTFSVVALGGFILIPLGTENDIIIVKSFFTVLALVFLYSWLYTGVLKKGYLELTEDTIRLKTAFGTKVVKWNEIYAIQVFTQSSNTILGIVLKEKVRKQKDSFGNLISEMFGGMYSVRIAMSQFPRLDLEKLYTTMLNRIIKENEKQNSDIVDSCIIEPEESNINNNFVVALMKVFMLSTIIGLAYGLSIHLIKSNIIIIPMFGSFAVIYYYNKLYKEERINIFIRMIVGLICTVQVFIGVIVAIVLNSRFSQDINYTIIIVKQYFNNIFKDPLENGVIIFLVLLCFSFGAFQGYKFKFLKKIEKLFMKKFGKYYYKRDGRNVTIYLKDPVLYNDQKEGMLIAQINKDCLIEKQKNKIKGLCIPVNYIEEMGIVFNDENCVKIKDKTYYKIDLGSNDNFEPYVFPCSLIMDSKKEVEVIEIEI